MKTNINKQLRKMLIDWLILKIRKIKCMMN